MGQQEPKGQEMTLGDGVSRRAKTIDAFAWTTLFSGDFTPDWGQSRTFLLVFGNFSILSLGILRNCGFNHPRPEGQDG
jgi:hypothetical protein